MLEKKDVCFGDLSSQEIVRPGRESGRDEFLRQSDAISSAGSLQDFPCKLESVPTLTRVVEIFIAVVVLSLSLPANLIVSFIIKRGSPGPVLFFQERLGLGGKTFKFVKFRTLYADARQRFPELYAYNYSSQDLEELHFKVTDDPRVTPQGKWLRKSTLDEMPNFWCLLTGEMALVGPRPEIPEMLPYYKGDMLKKFTVRPGITGLAQVSGRGRLSFFDTVNYDLEYVENKSLIFDIKITFKTFINVVTRNGAF